MKKIKDIEQFLYDARKYGDAYLLSNKYNVSVQRVRDICCEHGLTLARRSRMGTKTFRIVADILHTQLNEEELSIKFSCTIQYIKNIKRSMKESGIV